MHWREAESKEMFSLQLPSVCMHLHWDILDGTMAKKTGIFRSLIHTHKIFETAQHKNIKFYNAKMKRLASGKVDIHMFITGTLAPKSQDFFEVYQEALGCKNHGALEQNKPL